MPQIYRSSRGEVVDMDLMRISNENTIAIGNMRTNARGDELGPGGKVVKSRAQIMSEYHKLNSPVADDSPITSKTSAATQPEKPLRKLATPVADDSPAVQNDYVKPRGSFAGAVAEQTEVNQELLQPKNPSEGIKRI